MLSSELVKPFVKICGLKDVATIKQLNGLPINYVGLVFAKSKRQVSMELGAELVQAIHALNYTANHKVEAVAVVVDLPLAQLDMLVSTTRIDVIQLHGQEDIHYLKQCRVQFPNLTLWKALSIKDMETIDEQLSKLNSYSTYLDGVVIDAPGGGTGTVFNWNAIDRFLKLCNELQLPLFVAGGLNEDNIQSLLEQYNIHGVDVSSGVETNGIKDIQKIKAFVGKVRNS